MKDLVLKNGEVATFLYEDDWHRPTYRLENGVKACCTNLNGTFLHFVSPDCGEPEAPLKEAYQPEPIDVELDGRVDGNSLLKAVRAKGINLVGEGITLLHKRSEHTPYAVYSVTDYALDALEQEYGPLLVAEEQ